MDISNNDLKEKLGNIAILEGSFSIDKNGYLLDIMKALKIDTKSELILTNIYIEHKKLNCLPLNKVDTILMETTFSYQDKIYDVAKVIVGLYKETGWKPKYVVNTMNYGLNALWHICSKLDIEVFRIIDADDISKFGYALDKVEPSKEEKIKTSMEYGWFDELFDGIEKQA